MPMRPLRRMDGSSPRMRGTHAHGLAGLDRLRIIPAHAGNTRMTEAPPLGTTDHPRACGEHHCPATAARLAVGSSPRMRGTQVASSLDCPTHRIIPAHAGNTSNGGLGLAGAADHPRACGEHCLNLPRRQPANGSSPRMRGTLHYDGTISDGLRIIPAHAGNTHLPPRRSSASADHPRACGEHLDDDDLDILDVGSSPRMRGTHAPLLIGECDGRIIPAHAGNTLGDSGHAGAISDHPRACGEHSRKRWRPDRCRRIIPAHAGNTPDLSPPGRRRPDHPRACGEHFQSSS